MTTLSRISGARDSGRQPASPPPGATHLLLGRLRKECDRQAPFSETKVLLREAAAAIERLDAEVAALSALLAAERSARQAP